MRLYVIDDQDKVYLDYVAKSRKEIAAKVGSTKIKVNGKTFRINDVYADPENNIATTTAIGGVVGLFGGIPGLIAGSIVGGLIGNNNDKIEKIQTANFNKSKI